MVETNQDVNGYAGDTIPIVIDIKDDAGEPLPNISDYQFVWTLKRNYAQAVPDLVATSGNGITIISEPLAQIKVTISSVTSLGLYGQYVHVLVGVDTLGTVLTLADGTLKVSEKFTQIPYTTHYTTPEAVATQLRLTDGRGNRFVFSETTDPKRSEVAELINYKEAYIDKYTNNAWREIHVVDEIQSMPIPYQGVFPTYIATQLNNRNIISVEELNFMTGGGNENDWVATHQEGRGKDWYVVPFSGMLNMRRPLPYIYAKDNLRVSYTYGEGVAKLTIGSVTTYSYNVPLDIKEACTKLVAATFLENDWDRAILADGVQLSPSRKEVIEKWKEEAEFNLRRRMNYVNIGTM